MAEHAQPAPTCVWVLAASEEWESGGSLDWLLRPDKVVAADGGTTLALALGLTPDLIVGDLDSSLPDVVQRWAEAGIEVRRYDHHTKSETDTELAVLAALEWNPTSTYILGATGGRLDHTLANILLLAHPALEGRDVRLIEGRQEVYLAQPGQWKAISGEPGDLVTLLPLGDDVLGVVLEGFEYPLNHEPLPHGRGRGVSNVIARSGARLWYDSGLLMVVVSHL